MAKVKDNDAGTVVGLIGINSNTIFTIPLPTAMLLRTFFTAILLACLCVSHAQQEAPLRFDRVEGLSQTTGYSILKDKQGFLWIATPNGLNRYDGMEMKVYKPALEKKKGFMQGRIIRSSLLQDAQEQIWFSTDLTVHCFDKKKEEFRTYDLSDKKAHISLGGGTPGSKIFANPLFLKNDHLWLASATAGLFDLDTKTNDYVNYPLVLKDESGNDIPLMYNGAYDGQDKIWFASRKGLLSFNILNKQWKQYLQDKSCYTLSICRDTIFVSENNEIVWFDLKSSQYGYANFNEQGSEIKRDRILRVYTDAKLDTWVGDEKGNVYLKSSHSADFKWMGNINSNGTVRTNYPAYCFFSDTSGILWVGAYMLGLLKTEVTPKQFSMHPRPAANGVNENLFVNSIHEDEADKVWLGTFEKGIVILNKKTGETSPLKLPYTGPKLPYGNSVPLIRSDSKGNL
ncbi:MAG TPA: two-component regulator propeller domain-containing protein, partial [Flavisolibacter sp.]|nr:two-component regulator propeller domain-containing protein [Flavisolibacter sp.]